jgi:diguanylate cyclase (GGDEF)-like protein
MSKKKLGESQKRVVRFQVSITLAFVVIIVLSIFVVILNSLNKSSQVLKNKVSSLISTIDIQMEINIDNYLDTIENTSTLVFSTDPIYNDVIAYQYNPIKNSYDDYDKIKIEEAISNKLIEISLMENYCDFAIVYSDNNTIGKISKSTDATYSNNLYQIMEPVVTRQRTNDGWFSTNDEFVRLYYAKRVNDDAILLISFYVTELESIFARPENMSSMTIRLVDSENTMIYSSENEEIGQELSDDIKEMVANQDSAIVSNNDFIVSVSTCGDDWKIICSIPTSVVLKGNIETRNYTLVIGIIAILCSICAVAIITKMATKPVKNIVNTLNTKADTDLLTGILNKIAYEEKCTEIIEKEINLNHSLWIIDIDNFKNVNDTRGHAFGDQVIVGIANTLSSVFRGKGITGRFGGDEFSVLLTIPSNIDINSAQYEEYIENAYNNVKNKVIELSRQLDYDITLSIGCSCEKLVYSELFKTADTALYKSKSNGKNQITLYHKS